LEKIEEEDGEDNIWKFRSIDAYQGPLKCSDPTTIKDQAGMFEYSGKMGRSPMSLSQSLVSQGE